MFQLLLILFANTIAEDVMDGKFDQWKNIEWRRFFEMGPNFCRLWGSGLRKILKTIWLILERSVHRFFLEIIGEKQKI